MPSPSQPVHDKTQEDPTQDPILHSIVRELTTKNKCHTVILYGSRARGLATATSDYDVIGVRAKGKTIRIAKKQKGYFWDVFVYPEKELRKLGERHFSWKNAKIIFQKGNYATKLLGRIEANLKTPFKCQPAFEITALKVWAQKELERCRKSDIQGLFRRAEFLAALIDHYFFIRQKQFWGPKAGFAWLKQNDPTTYFLIEKALQNPKNLVYLRAAASRVYRTKLI